jgi:F420-non-reducing hydrogenase small subunit
MKEKLKLAIGLGATCSGCDIAILDVHERILDVLEVADIVFCPTIIDTKLEDLEAMEEASIDVTLYHGAVRNSENEHMAELLRRKSKTMVAFGSCACFGGVPGLANVANKREIFEIAYKETPSTDNPEFVVPKEKQAVPEGELSLPSFYDEVYALDDKVDVDYYFPGCPPTPDFIMNAITAIVRGELPQKGATIALDKTLCDECELEKAEVTDVRRIYRPHEITVEPGKCLLDQGLICLGPATRAGCGGLCTKVYMPCRGCMGPTAAIAEQGGSMLSAVASLLGLSEEGMVAEVGVRELMSQIKDPLGTFYRFSMPKSLLRKRA